MLYYSTQRTAPLVNFREATLRGQSPDKGLYFPETIPALSTHFLTTLKQKPKEEVAFEVIKPYTGNCLSDEELYNICAFTVAFDIPLKPITEKIFSLELFHGPTLAFKDVGARFMSRCLSSFSKKEGKKTTVLVATSGDTGSAVANGFGGAEGVEVVILYPSGKVSRVQELQLTTMGQNIIALEVAGTFDDCQHMVKQAFADRLLNEKLLLTSANSINVARWLPQQFYYFFAWQQWPFAEAPIICVPSGNFGNIAAGMVAAKSGLPVKKFVAACNANHVFVDYLQSGKYAPAGTTATLSNAMDVGNPSNFVRILEIYENNFSALQRHVSAYSISDEETLHTIKKVWAQHSYLLDPHGAVGYAALERELVKNNFAAGLFLETAHPVKFNETVTRATGVNPPLPQHISQLLRAQKNAVAIDATYPALREFLLHRT